MDEGTSSSTAKKRSHTREEKRGQENATLSATTCEARGQHLFFFASKWRQHICRGYFQSLCRVLVVSQPWSPYRLISVVFSHNASKRKRVFCLTRHCNLYGKSPEVVYGNLVIKRIFAIKRIVSCCGYYKRMRLTTGLYGS